MSSRVLPVVALDIDDTINVWPLPEGADPADWVVVDQLYVPAGAQPQSPFVRGGGKVDQRLPVAVRRRVIDWVRRVHGVTAEVMWATTWEDAARTHFAPAVGLPDLEVLIDTRRFPPKFGMVRYGDTAAWKEVALRDAVPADRPLVWLDDQAYTFEAPAPFDPPPGWYDHLPPEQRADAARADWEQEVRARRLRRTSTAAELVIAPLPGAGLTDDDLQRVDAWLAQQQ